MKNAIELTVVTASLMMMVGSAVGVTPVPASKMAEFNARTGGLVQPPADAKKLLLLDARRELKTALTNFQAAVDRQIGASCEIRDITFLETDPLTTARRARTGSVGSVILFYEDEKAPTLISVPEEAIALLNVRPLIDKNYQTYRRRFSKEFWRALAFALGAYCNGTSQMGGSVMEPVFSKKDLDNVKSFTLSPMQISFIARAKARLNIYGSRPVPYSRACREGWAPAPTNEVQRKFYTNYGDPTRRFDADFVNPILPKSSLKK